MENIFSILRKIIDPHHLVVNNVYQCAYKLQADLIRSTPDSTRTWHIVGTTNLSPGTYLRFLGTVKSNHLVGELPPKHLLFEITNNPVRLDTDAQQEIKPTVGDLISLTPDNRSGITQSPKS